MQNILKAQKVFGKLDGCLAGIVHALLVPVGLLKNDLAAKGGPVGVWNTGLRLLLVALNLRQHLQVREAISGPHTKGILAVYPRVVYRYTLPYLAMGFSRQARLEMLKGHYEFINIELSSGFFAQILNESLVIWERVLEDSHFSIVMAGPCLHREGDLTLIFKMDGTPLYKLAFSIIDFSLLRLPVKALENPSDSALYVGQVQGCPGHFESIRKSTKACLDVAPPDLLMAALFGVACALRINVVAGVDSESNLSFHRMVKFNVDFNYSDFWTRQHAIKSDGGHYIFNLPVLDKPITEIKSNHRRRTLLKRELRKSISDAAAAAMYPMVLSHVRP